MRIDAAITSLQGFSRVAPAGGADAVARHAGVPGQPVRGVAAFGAALADAERALNDLAVTVQDAHTEAKNLYLPGPEVQVIERDSSVIPTAIRARENAPIISVDDTVVDDWTLIDGSQAVHYGKTSYLAATHRDDEVTMFAAVRLPDSNSYYLLASKTPVEGSPVVHDPQVESLYDSTGRKLQFSRIEPDDTDVVQPALEGQSLLHIRAPEADKMDELNEAVQQARTAYTELAHAVDPVVLADRDPRFAVDAWFAGRADDEYLVDGYRYEGRLLGIDNGKLQVLSSQTASDAITEAQAIFQDRSPKKRNSIVVVQPFPDRPIYAAGYRGKPGSPLRVSHQPIVAAWHTESRPYIVGLVDHPRHAQQINLVPDDLRLLNENQEAALADPERVVRLHAHATRTESATLKETVTPVFGQMLAAGEPAARVHDWMTQLDDRLLVPGYRYEGTLEPYASNALTLVPAGSAEDAVREAQALFGDTTLAVVQPFPDEDIFAVGRIHEQSGAPLASVSGNAWKSFAHRNEWLVGYVDPAGGHLLDVNDAAHRLAGGDMSVANDPMLARSLAAVPPSQVDADVRWTVDQVRQSIPVVAGRLEEHLSTDPLGLVSLYRAIRRVEKAVGQMTPTNETSQAVTRDVLDSLAAARKTILRGKRNEDGVKGYFNFPDYQHLGQILTDLGFLQTVDPQMFAIRP